MSKHSFLETELQRENARLKELVEALLRENGALKERIAELEKRLSLTSQTSSKPPSSDGLRRPRRTESLREAGKNKSGGQAGHPGQTLCQVATPDQVVVHEATHCAECAQALADAPVVEVIKRQVFDLPLPRLELTEHQVPIKICPHCRHHARAAFPESVNAPVQYGNNVRTMGVYLQQQHFIPEDRLQQLFDDLYGLSISTASLAQFSQEAAAHLAPLMQVVYTHLQQAPVKHLDETGLRVVGQTQWAHVASNQKLTYYVIKPKRTCEWEGFTGTAIHDGYPSYYTQLPKLTHALCNQHHLRELQALIRHEAEPWASQMQRFLRRMLRYRHAYEDRMIPLDNLKRIEKRYQSILTQGLAYHHALPPCARQNRKGRIKRRTGHNLLIRLDQYQSDVLRFLADPAVPFTNNQAEQDIRMVKCKQKISGSFRSEHGANTFACIRGFISTARKQAWNIFSSLQHACHNRLDQLLAELVPA